MVSRWEASPEACSFTYRSSVTHQNYRQFRVFYDKLCKSLPEKGQVRKILLYLMLFDQMLWCAAGTKVRFIVQRGGAAFRDPHSQKRVTHECWWVLNKAWVRKTEVVLLSACRNMNWIHYFVSTHLFPSMYHCTNGILNNYNSVFEGSTFELLLLVNTPAGSTTVVFLKIHPNCENMQMCIERKQTCMSSY